MIVDNHSSFTLLLARESVKDEHLRPIAQGLDLDYNDLVARVQRFRKQPKYVPIAIKDELTPADLAFVDSHRDFFPELVLIQSAAAPLSEERHDGPRHRVHRRNQRSRNWIRRTSPSTTRATWSANSASNASTTTSLMGVDGQRQVVVDNRGQVRQTLATKTAVPGKDLQLTIDLDLQTVAELAMDGQERRGGGARSAHRRSAGHGQPPDLRPQ